MRGFQRFLRDDKATTAIEYGLVGSLVAVVIAVTISLVGGSLRDAFQRILDAFTG